MNGTKPASRSGGSAKRSAHDAAAVPTQPPVVQDIPTSHVSVTGGTQMRTCLNDDVVQDYIDRMALGDVFPPIVVFQDGVKYWLADGFHRFRARCSSYAETIRAEVHVGTLSDAIAYAVGANKANGLRRTNADKQMAVRAALAHERLRELSDREIAAVVGVSHPFVARMRSGMPPQLVTDSSRAHVPEAASLRTGADGKRRRLPRPRTTRNQDVTGTTGDAVSPARGEPLPEGRFGVIYAEPSWPSRDGLVEVRLDGPTWTAAELCALDVKQIAADDSVLCLWAPCAVLPDALKVMKAWGFAYQTSLVFDREKSVHGRQHTFHVPTAELLLIGTRGKCPPDPDERPMQVHAYAPRRSSAKTNHFRSMVRRMFPERQRVLLFGQEPPPSGWVGWGIHAVEKAA